MPKQIEVHVAAPQWQAPIDLSCGEIRDEAAARVRLNGWLKKFLTEKRSPLPVGFDRVIRPKMRGQTGDPDIEVVGGWAKQEMASQQGGARAEIEVADWVFDFLKNSISYKGARKEKVPGSEVKKAGASTLDEVLERGEGDCLGFSKMYRYVAGKFFGLDVGIIEVVKTIKGQQELHACGILKTRDGSQLRTVDIPYKFNISPSSNKRHPLIRLRTRAESGELRDICVADSDFGRLQAGQTSGLSENAIKALTKVDQSFYMWYLGKDAAGIVSLLDEAVRLDPNCMWAYANRAVSRLATNSPDYDGIIADCEKALALNPRLNAPKVNILAALIKQEDYDRVIELADHFLSPTNPNALTEERHKALALLTRGTAHREKGNLAQAEEDYRQVQRIGILSQEHGGEIFSS